MGLFAKPRLPKTNAETLENQSLVLLIDDEDANLRVMQATLQDHYQVLLAHDGQQALEIVKNLQSPEKLACIISDQRMPGLTGVEFFQQSQHLAPHSIRIIVTGFSDLDAIINSINRAEVFKFISKPFEAHDFFATVEQAIELFNLKLQQHIYYQDLENQIKQRTQELEQKKIELEHAQKSLTELTITDPLTQMRNRRFLLQRLDADITITLRRHEEWMRRGCPGTLLDVDLVFFYVDLDHFKQFNLQYGPAAGDSVLSQMHERLQEVFRESDYLVRWGDEQFLIVARATNRSEAGVVAERIRHAVASRHFQFDENRHAPLTCSIGFAAYPFANHAPRAIAWPQVVDLAEQAMLMAKEAGRNAWQGLYATEQTEVANILQFVVRDCCTAMQMGQIQIVKSMHTSDR